MLAFSGASKRCLFFERLNLKCSSPFYPFLNIAET
nr:MAG TPA: hypothetical protein [Caudoviricetes sp.]